MKYNLTTQTPPAPIDKKSRHPIEQRDCEVVSEEVFNRMLALERKRTERTGDHFLLMLLDFTEVNHGIGERQIMQICGAIGAEARDTDIVGWYERPSTVGILFTLLRKRDRTEIRLILLEKASQVLRARLENEDLGRVGISFHFFPEEMDKTKSSFESDKKLYPDLKDRERSRSGYHFIKRVMDIAGSLFGIVLFSPLFLILPILIKLTSKGPVFFRQPRTGRFGKEFLFLKFRTMYTGNDPEIHKKYVTGMILEGTNGGAQKKCASGEPLKIVNDPRVTPLGRFLRRTSMDELPQFFNVLRGDMSLVGPRPPIPYEIAVYGFWHRRRLVEVKPGITGLWQVEGRSRTTFDEMVRLDLLYVRKQSLWLDLKIILKTPRALLSGAY